MDKSQVKEMVREVVTEIYQKGEMPKDPLDFLAQLANRVAGEDPRLNDPSRGQLIANQSLNSAIEAFKQSIRGYMGKSPEILSRSSEFYTIEMAKLIQFIGVWGSNIIRADPTKQEEVLRIVKDVRNHAMQATSQGRAAFENMESWGNFINARKQIEHAKEIFDSLRESINELFELSKRYQYEE